MHDELIVTRKFVRLGFSVSWISIDHEKRLFLKVHIEIFFESDELDTDKCSEDFSI